MKKEGKMSEYTEIKKEWEHYKSSITGELHYLIDIIEKQREAINELLANIELAHPEEYKQYRELPSVDKILKLTEE